MVGRKEGKVKKKGAEKQQRKGDRKGKGGWYKRKKQERKELSEELREEEMKMDIMKENGRENVGIRILKGENERVEQLRQRKNWIKEAKK